MATPAVIFWLWLVIVPARAAILCPEGCWCDGWGSYVKCRSSLNSIPLMFPRGVETLSLSYNNITSFEKDTFISRELTELKELYAENCQLRKIELEAFKGLTNLRRLVMSNNEISEITPGTFENMSSLEYLFLGNNKIERLEVDAFYGLSNLERLFLRLNKLQHIHPDMFVELPKLEYLDLSGNPGLKIPIDRQFINSHSLTTLNISACNVSSVSVETFSNVTTLEWLYLRINNLRCVDINILRVLPNLSVLYVHGNPLHCDCQLQKLWRWCQDHNIQTAFENTAPKCDTPSAVHGKWWGVLEQGQCLKGNMISFGGYKNKAMVPLILRTQVMCTNIIILYYAIY
jgi:hypothetical protein